MYLFISLCIKTTKPYKSRALLKVTHTREGMYFNTTKGMKDLTIIKSQNENFVLVDKETDSYGLKAYYVPQSLYNNGDYSETDIIIKEVEYQYQIQERLSGWAGYDYDQPEYLEPNVYPGDDDFDLDLAETIALEVANELITQHEITTAYV